MQYHCFRAPDVLFQSTYAAALLILAALIGMVATSSARAQEIKVDYTGRLFGYYRIEPMEPVTDDLTGAQIAKLSVVRPFLKDRKGSPSLLLGMGDNFAPEFGAAIQQEFKRANVDWAPCSSPQASLPQNINDPNERKYFAPESLYKSKDRLPAMADCDNVTRFLMTAGYRAIVPGREDFIYTATWVRRIALLLKGASVVDPAQAEKNPFNTQDDRWRFGTIADPDRKLYMLAANLRVKESKTACPLIFTDDLADDSHPCSQGDTTITAEMDWLRRVDQTLQSPLVQASLNRQAFQNPEFRRQLLANQAQIVSTLLTGYDCKVPSGFDRFGKAESYIVNGASVSLAPLKEDDKSTLRSPVPFPLTCDALAGSPSQRNSLSSIVTNLMDVIAACTGTIDANTPMLMTTESRKDVVRLLLNLIYAEQKDIGYTIATTPGVNGKRVLIIGVLGKETMQEISCENLLVHPDRDDGSLPKPDDKSQPCEPRQKGDSKIPGLQVVVGDPRFAVATLLRAAWDASMRHLADSDFDAVLVMAQMPHTEADELGAHVRSDIEGLFKTEALYQDKDGKPLPGYPAIDLILSEAQDGHQTPNMTISMVKGSDTPVLTPADVSSPKEGVIPNPVSTVTLSDQDPVLNPPYDRLLVNSLPTRIQLKKDYEPNPNDTAAGSLETEFERAIALSQSRQIPGQIQAPDLNRQWADCLGDGGCQNALLMQYLLHQIQRSSGADVVLLKRRDFYFDWLGSEYTDYDVCKTWAIENNYSSELPPVPDTVPPTPPGPHLRYCQLHTALDRVLWKGDYSERVMVDGTTLTGLMQTAQQQTDQEQTLLARDLHQEWLMTYGIVSVPPKNLAAAASGPEAFSVPGVDGCNAPPSPLVGKDSSGAASGPPYCIDGQSVASDRSYWLSTSDQLAQDSTVYSALGSVAKKNPHYTQRTNYLYITTEIANEVFREGQPPNKPRLPTDAPESNLAFIDIQHQARDLVQLDFAKLAAGYSVTSPDLNDATLAAKLSGVSNSQATTPHSQELDLEAATRLTYAPVFKWVTFGSQSDAEYDRKYTGNLTGSPETVAYSANNYTVGGFAQVYLPFPWRKETTGNNIDRGTRNLPRAFLVLAPYQFQRQLAANYLALPYYTPSSTPNTPGTTSKSQFLNIPTPVPLGFNQRIGFRFEASGIPKWTPDPGSYIEIGPEYAVQNNVLSAIHLPQLLPPYNSCPASAINPFLACVKANYTAAQPQVPLNASSIITPVSETLHAGGFYWNSHIQKVIDSEKKYAVSFDTSGDSFLLPGVTLTTQTRYAFTTKLALNFKIIPSLANLTLSPTYTNFYFENQGVSSQRTGLIATTFSISAKWYFARDAAVPFPKQGWFTGPASVDQTGSAKIK